MVGAARTWDRPRRHHHPMLAACRQPRLLCWVTSLAGDASGHARRLLGAAIDPSTDSSPPGLLCATVDAAHSSGWMRVRPKDRIRWPPTPRCRHMDPSRRQQTGTRPGRAPRLLPWPPARSTPLAGLKQARSDPRPPLPLARSEPRPLACVGAGGPPPATTSSRRAFRPGHAPACAAPAYAAPVRPGHVCISLRGHIRPVSTTYSARLYHIFGPSLPHIRPVSAAYTARLCRIFGPSLPHIRPVSAAYSARLCRIYSPSLPHIRPVSTAYTARLSRIYGPSLPHIRLVSTASTAHLYRPPLRPSPIAYGATRAG